MPRLREMTLAQRRADPPDNYMPSPSADMRDQNASTRHPTTTRGSHTWRAFWIACNTCPVLIATCFATGCNGAAGAKDHHDRSPSTRASPAISAVQAEGIARKKVEHVGPHKFELQPARLVEDRFWRVLVETPLRGSNSLTYNLFGDLSRNDAEALATAMASNTVPDAKCRVKDAQLIQDYYWHVLVWWLPAMPEGFITLHISANDGTIIEPSL